LLAIPAKQSGRRWSDQFQILLKSARNFAERQGPAHFHDADVEFSFRKTCMLYCVHENRMLKHSSLVARLNQAARFHMHYF
jgi:hypothetical protein